MLIDLIPDDRAIVEEKRKAATPFTNANTGTTIRNILTVFGLELCRKVGVNATFSWKKTDVHSRQRAS